MNSGARVRFGKKREQAHDVFWFREKKERRSKADFAPRGQSVMMGSEFSGHRSPNRSLTKWVRFGKEEQRRERETIF